MNDGAAATETDERPGEPLPPEPAAIAAVLGTALVGWALSLPADRADIRRSRLYNRYRTVGGWRWAVRLREQGIESVCMKGLAAAAALYPDPDLRAMADADLLVRPEDVRPALNFLLSQGFAVGQEPTRHPWGMIGDASAEPLVSPEGSNLDLHRYPDAWPLHEGLSTADVLAASLHCETPEGRVRIPCPEHQILIAASNAARDLFDPPSLKLVIDGAFLLHRYDTGAAAGSALARNALASNALNWDAIEGIAGRSDTLRGLRSYLTLMSLLGFETGRAPDHLFLRPSGHDMRLLRRLAADLAAGRFSDPAQDHGLAHRLLREVLISGSLRIVVRRNLLRLVGLIRPHRGMFREAD